MENKLINGIAYCEVKFVSTTDRNGMPLVSKKTGDPMVNVQLNVVDKEGNTGVIYDYMMKSTPWKMFNLENATGRKGFYNAETGHFNTSVFLGASCCASIERDENPSYGSKIKTYIPIAFFNVAAEQGKNTHNQVADEPQNSSLSSGYSPGIISIEDDDDGIPF